MVLRSVKKNDTKASFFSGANRSVKHIILFTVIFLTVFGVGLAKEPLTLQDCIELGMKYNFEIKKYNLDILIAKENTLLFKSRYEPLIRSQLGRAQITNVGSAALFGSEIKRDAVSIGFNKKLRQTGGRLSLDWEKERKDSGSVFIGLADVINPSYQSKARLSYVQPILKNFAASNDKKNIQILKLTENIAELALSGQKKMLKNKIEKAYLNMNFAYQNLAIQKTFLNRVTKLLYVNRQRFKDGLIDEVDVIATESAVILRKASILFAEDKLKNAKDNLINIIGLSVGGSHNFIIEYPSAFNHSKLNESQTIKAALSQRNDLKIIEKIVQINEINNRIKQNEKLPSLDLKLQYSLNSYAAEWRKSFSSFEPSWYVGLNLNLFPFGKRSSAIIRQSRHEHSKNIAAIEKQKSTIITEARIITRTVNTLALYVDSARKVKKLQEKKLQLEEVKFEHGRTSIHRLLNFQDDLSRAEIEVHKALTDYYKAVANLKLITGFDK